MPTDDNYIITTTICIGRSFMFIQCNHFVSVTGQLLALLDKRSLVCLNFLSTLCGLQNTAFLQIYGSYKLECYTHSLKPKLK